MTVNGITRRAVLVGGLLPALTSCSDGVAAAGWTMDPSNPVLGGLHGTCNDPFVARHGNRYRMWFSWRRKKSIAYTESSDGVHWTEPVVVLRPDPANKNEIRVNRASVLLMNGLHHMWFTSQSSGTSEILSATSKNGEQWTRARAVSLHPELDWEKTSIMCPHVIYDSDGRQLRMYYSGGEQYEPDAIGLAVSSDGKHWRRYSKEPIFRSDPDNPWERAKVSGAFVIASGGWYYMFYIGFSDVNHASIGIARSRDGIRAWQRHPDNPILKSPGFSRPLAWDRDAIYKPAVVLDDQGWWLWFNARFRGFEQIGLARHPSRDLGFRIAT